MEHDFEKDGAETLTSIIGRAIILSDLSIYHMFKRLGCVPLSIFFKIYLI